MSEKFEFDLQANDKAAPVVSKVREEIERLNATMDQGGKTAEGSSKLFGMSIESLSMAVGVAGAVISGAVAAFKKGWEMAQQGAEVERIKEGFESVASAYEVSSERMLVALRKASQGAISDVDLMKTANLAMLLGVTTSADEMAKLLEIATVRGRALGLTTQKAFEDIARGIGRSSPLILDNLGIIVDAKSNYEEYARSIGKTADELTKAEKTQALMNAVMKDGERILAETNGVVKDSRLEWERMNAEFENTENTINEKLAPAYSRLASMAADAAIAFRTTIVEAEGVRLPIVAAFDLFKEWATLRMQNGLAEQEFQENLKTTGMIAYHAGQQTSEAAIEMSTSLEEIEERAKMLSDRYKGLLALFQSVHSASEAYTQKVSELVTEKERLSAEIEKNVRWYGENSKKVGELREEYDQVISKLDEVEREHTEATNKIIYNNLMTKLSIDGITDAEFEMAQQVGVSLGIFSQKSADTAIQINELTGAVAAGRISVEQLGDAINMLPSGKTVDVIIDILTNARDVYQINSSNQPSARAFYGNVSPMGKYEVNERGQEFFTPFVAGTIGPAPASGGAASITINLEYSPTISTSSSQEVVEMVYGAIQSLKNDGLL